MTDASCAPLIQVPFGANFVRQDFYSQKTEFGDSAYCSCNVCVLFGLTPYSQAERGGERERELYTYRYIYVYICIYVEKKSEINSAYNHQQKRSST